MNAIPKDRTENPPTEAPEGKEMEGRPRQLEKVQEEPAPAQTIPFPIDSVTAEQVRAYSRAIRSSDWCRWINNLQMGEAERHIPEGVSMEENQGALELVFVPTEGWVPRGSEGAD